MSRARPDEVDDPEDDVEDRAKQAAARAAADLVEDGMLLGLGTGSTVTYFLDALAERSLDVAGVPTSQATTDRCRELGIALLDPGDVESLDLAVDGADEVDPDLTVTKGGGGALLREKVVAAMARTFVVIATPDKVVDRLADTFPLPVEVVPFAVGPVRRHLVDVGFTAELRSGADDEPYRTDNGNAIVDVRFPGGLTDAAVTDVALTLQPGVVTTGLFVDLVDLVLLGRADGGVDRLERPTPTAAATGD